MAWFFVPEGLFVPELTGCEPWRPGFEHLASVEGPPGPFAPIGREPGVSGLEQSAVSWRFERISGLDAEKGASPAVRSRHEACEVRLRWVKSTTNYCRNWSRR